MENKKQINYPQQTESDPNTLWINYMQLFYRMYTFMDKRYRQNEMKPVTWKEFYEMRTLFENNLNNLKYNHIPSEVVNAMERKDESIRRTKVRLTESQLRGVIRQCVNEALNEVKYAGQSLHGTNPEDWWAVGYLRGHEGQMDKEKKDMDNAKSVELSYDNIAKLTRLPQAKKDYLENYDKQLVDNNKELFKKARTACSYYGNVGKWTRINWFKTAIKAGLPKQDRIRLWKYAQRKNNERYGIA